MSWKVRIRQFHRWTAVTFMVFVAVVTVVVATADEPAEWVYLSPLLPLFLLMGTGIVLFLQPYAARRRRDVLTR